MWPIWLWILEGVALAVVLWALVLLIRGQPETTPPVVRRAAPAVPEKTGAEGALIHNAQVTLVKAADRRSSPNGK